MSDSSETAPPAARAIVVDNNAANLYYAGKILRSEGYEVFPVKTYYEALSALSGTDSDLLLADIRLDSGNGIELARLALSRQPELTILLMTAYRDEELRAEHISIPVIRVPFSRRNLVNTVQRLRVLGKK